MGCLIVQINGLNSQTLKVSAREENSPVNGKIIHLNTPIEIGCTSISSDILGYIDGQNTPIYVKTNPKNIKINISVALVCRVSLNQYEYFYVLLGPLIVENGYFKVKKQRV